ncbi:MAG: hypothetical protein H7256_03515 [Bdellovibrio sp.]|nr:hypothetical protein [Bdellovibrio sp.]
MIFKQKMILSLSLALIFGMHSGAFAAGQIIAASDGKGPVTPVSSLVQISPEEMDPDGKRLILEGGVEYAQKVAKDEVEGREAGTEFTLVLGYKLSSLFSLKAKGIITKQEDGPKDTSYSNTQLTLSIKGKKLNDQFETVHAVTAVIPTNKDSIERDRLKGAFALANGIHYDGVFASATYILSLAKNIHEFNFNADGKANIEYTLSNSLEVVVPMGDMFSISLAGLFKNGRTYGGFERSSFGFSADLNIAVSKNLGINLGTSNEGAGVKPNGTDSNIAAYDANSSVFRLGASYAY